MNPLIKKFWDGPGVSFFEMEVVPPLPKGEGFLNGYYHSLYCRSEGGFYQVVAKTKPYLVGKKPDDIKYEMFYLNKSSPNKYWTEYSEEEILRIIRMKMFL